MCISVKYNSLQLSPENLHIYKENKKQKRTNKIRSHFIVFCHQFTSSFSHHVVCHSSFVSVLDRKKPKKKNHRRNGIINHLAFFSQFQYHLWYNTNYRYQLQNYGIKIRYSIRSFGAEKMHSSREHRPWARNCCAQCMPCSFGVWLAFLFAFSFYKRIQFNV